MCFKIDTFIIVVALNLVVFYNVQVQGCKLFCVTCDSDVQFNLIPKFYCCMQDWENQPTMRDCVYKPVTSSSTSTSTATTLSTSTSTVTPCPTLQLPSPSPYRCPEVGKPAPGHCEAIKRIHPNPTYCTADSDCIHPFNVCCEDSCFKGRICKTYREAEQ